MTATSIRFHVVTEPDFAALASGYGDGDVIGRLRAGQRSKNLHQLLALLRSPEAAGTALPAGFSLLAEVQDAAPDVVAELLTHPHVSAWLAHCVRAVAAGSSDSRAEPLDTVLGHLAGIAVAAAIGAGVEFAVTVPARDGEVLLPGLGRAAVAGRTSVVVAGGAAGFRIDGQRIDPDSPGDGWEPVHRLSTVAAGVPLAITLDDLDWYRDSHGLGATGRLDGETVARWQETLNAAWAVVVRDHREYAEPIAVGLRTLVPLRSDLINRGVSATSTESFGAVILSEPTDHLALAVALVHEFQHAKLGALMDLVPLIEGAEEPQYYAPWREDPRPLTGLLHGTYAFLAVTDFWRVRRAGGGDNDGYAHFEFARWRERLLQVIRVLGDSGRLTPEGERFLAGMKSTVDGWRTEGTPRLEDRLARAAADDHRLSWRLRNLRCRPESVAALALAWSEGESNPPAVELTTRTCEGERVFRQHARLHLTALRVNDPARFDLLAAGQDDPAGLLAELPDATDADVAYACDRYADAIAGYSVLLDKDPGDLAHWSGLILAFDGLGADPVATAALYRAPEWIVAVRQAVRAAGGLVPDPAELARWLAPAIGGPPAADR